MTDSTTGADPSPTTALRIDVFSLFPGLVDQFCAQSLLGKARTGGVLDLRCHDIRDEATDVHRTVDDAPYGGGAGMVMKAGPIFASVEAVDPPRPLLLMSPGGRRFDQSMAAELSELADTTGGFSLLCGRYEGIDERLIQQEVDEEWSLGDYVISGGELAAMVCIDAMTRLLPGALGHDDSAQQDSFSEGLLDYPHYTRPEDYRGVRVPQVLMNGNHRDIDTWREQQALGRTWQRRPDLLEAISLDARQQGLLDEFIAEFERTRKR